MKTLLKKILVLAVMLGTYTSYANDTLEVATTFNYVKKGHLISVSDDSGEVIYSGKINYNGNLTTLFDFSQLKNGKYLVEINKDFEIVFYSIDVKSHIVSYLKDSKKKIYKPVFRTKGDKVLISKLALDAEEVKIDFYYENELIYSETLEGGEVINRVYKLDETQRGDYKAVIKSDDRVYIEEFRI